MRDMATKITKFIDNKYKSDNLTYYTDYPTEPITCLGIGPHWDYKFEGITNHLPLL
jgi:hypothetical protein